MATAADLIKSSLRLIGAIASGETPTAAEQADAFAVLNQMLDSWSTQELAIYAKVREEFSLTAGQQLRTMGASGNFATTRPVLIEAATIEDQSSSGTPEYPLDIIYVQQWAGITQKSLESTFPQTLYVEDTYPNLNLYFWPVPSAANKVVLYSLKPLTAFASTATTISYPPGYEEALRYNLAIRLAPEFGLNASPDVVALAMEFKANIKRKNIKPEFLKCDGALLSNNHSYNIYRGEY